MNNLTPRQQFTLNRLLDEDRLELQDIEKQFNVSERTVFREINSINKFLRKYSLSVYYDKNMELSISGNKENIKELKTVLSSVPIQWLLSREQRQIIIASELLISKEAVKASYYSSKFNVVLGSISFDLEEIAKWAISKDLCLVRNRSVGISIQGSEWNKRNALVDLIFKYKPYEELLAFLYDEQVDKSIEVLFNMIFGKDITSIGKGILRKIDLSQYNLNDIKYFTLFIQILTAIKKAGNKREISIPEKIKKDIVELDEYKKIINLNNILKENNINLTEDDLIYIWFNLTDYKFLINKNQDLLDIDYKIISKEVIKEVSQKININLEEDAQLVGDLAKHFMQTFNMLNLGLKIVNPLIDEIKNHYLELFNVVNNVSKLVFSRYNFRLPKEEVGYITLHIDVALQRKQTLLKKLNILIVCPSGIGSAKILSDKIKFIFPDVNDIFIETLRDIDKYINNDKYDLILSTVPIKLEHTVKKVIVVSTFITKEDIEKINKFILNLKIDNKEINANKISDIKSNIITNYEYETSDDIIKNLQVKTTKAGTIEDLVDFIVEDIKKLGLIKNKEILKQAILKREEKGNVVIHGTNVALLHTRNEELAIPFVGVYRIETPIITTSVGFSKEEVNTFLVMIARSEESNYMLKFLGKISIALIEDEKFVEDLKVCSLANIRKHLIDIVNREEE